MALPYPAGGHPAVAEAPMDDGRVQRIEEAVAFADQRADGLDEALRDVADRMMSLVQRLERLESRLSALEQADPGPEGAVDESDPATDRPPHSGRLPGDR
ncbi:MAG: SlyX family protein [Planctomycetota bacterium]